jgi:hypothetical protein
LTNQKAGRSEHEFTWPADHSWPQDQDWQNQSTDTATAWPIRKQEVVTTSLPGLRIIVGHKIWIGPFNPIIQNGHHHALPRYALLREKDLQHYRIVKLTRRKI